MTLVDDYHVVAQLAEVDSLGAEHAIRSYEDAALPFEALDLGKSFRLLEVVKLSDFLLVRAPLLQFCLPVLLKGRRHHN